MKKGSAPYAASNDPIFSSFWLALASPARAVPTAVELADLTVDAADIGGGGFAKEAAFDPIDPPSVPIPAILKLYIEGFCATGGYWSANNCWPLF